MCLRSLAEEGREAISETVILKLSNGGDVVLEG